MKRHVTALLVAMLAVSGCTYGGHYVRSGPCEGWHTDSEACKRAAANGAAVERVKIGQTFDEVRAIIGTPEGREADRDREKWRYLTDYDNERETIIVFEGGVVVAIEQAQ